MGSWSECIGIKTPDPSEFWLGSCCIPTGIPLHSNWDPTVFQLGSHCIPTGIPLHSNWDPTVFQLGSRCIPTGIPLYSNWDPSWNTVGSQFEWSGISGFYPKGIPQGILVGSHWVSHSYFRLGYGLNKISACRLQKDWIITNSPVITWSSSCENVTYRIGHQHRLRWACTVMQSRQRLHCSHTHSMEVNEGFDL